MDFKLGQYPIHYIEEEGGNEPRHNQPLELVHFYGADMASVSILYVAEVGVTGQKHILVLKVQCYVFLPMS